MRPDRSSGLSPRNELRMCETTSRECRTSLTSVYAIQNSFNCRQWHTDGLVTPQTYIIYICIWVCGYTSQFPTLIVTNIDMLNLFKSRILQSFLNFLIGAVVEDCGVFITTVFCDGLEGEVISYHWRYILIVKKMKIFSVVSNISMILFQKPLS